MARIVPTVDRAKATVMTKIRFEQLDPRILPEMSAKVVFLSQRRHATPTSSRCWPSTRRPWSQRDGRPVVLRIGAGDALEAVPVTPGRTLGDALEVGGGALKPGDRLVLGPGDEAGRRRARHRGRQVAEAAERMPTPPRR